MLLTDEEAQQIIRLLRSAAALLCPGCGNGMPLSGATHEPTPEQAKMGMELNRCSSLPAVRMADKLNVSLSNPVQLSGGYRKMIKLYEAELIRQALQATNGRITAAARLLGLKHQALDSLLSKRHVNLTGFRMTKFPRRKRNVSQTKNETSSDRGTVAVGSTS